MRSLLAAWIVLLGTMLAQGPPDYQGARRDLEVAPALTLPAAPAVGMTVTDPFFPGSTIYVCTNGKYQTSDNGQANPFSVDDRMIALTIVGAGSTQVFNFDPFLGTCDPVPGAVFYTGNRTFSHVVPGRLYTQEGTKLYQNDLLPTGIAARTLLYDYANSGCLGVGYRATWIGVMSIAWDDRTFPMAFSSSGGQETGHQVAVYRPALGCRVLDTQSGTVTGQWGPTGTISTANRLLMHEGAGFLDGIHVRYEAGKCLAGACVPEVWDAFSLDVQDCGAALDCGGHSANGMFYAVNGTGTGNWWSRPITNFNVSPPKLIPEALVPTGIEDQQHTAWANDKNGQQPFFAAYSGPDNGMGKGFNAPWDGEVIGVSLPAVPGFGVPFREFHTFASGTNPNFVCAQTTGQSSQTGKFFVWTTDFGTPNCYVVVGVLR